MNDAYGYPTTFVVDLIDSESPLIAGLNLEKHTDTLNRAEPPRICFQRPCDTADRTFFTFIARDEGGCERKRLALVANHASNVRSLMCSGKKRRILNVIKRV